MGKLKVTEGVDRTYRKALLDFQRQWWTDCLERHGGSVSAAGRAAGEERSSTYKLLRKIGLAFVLNRYNRGNWGDLTH